MNCIEIILITRLHTPNPDTAKIYGYVPDILTAITLTLVIVLKSTFFTSITF